MPKNKPFINQLIEDINWLNDNIPNLAYYIAVGIFILFILSQQ